MKTCLLKVRLRNRWPSVRSDSWKSAPQPHSTTSSSSPRYSRYLHTWGKMVGSSAAHWTVVIQSRFRVGHLRSLRWTVGGLSPWGSLRLRLAFFKVWQRKIHLNDLAYLLRKGIKYVHFMLYNAPRHIGSAGWDVLFYIYLKNHDNGYGVPLPILWRWKLFYFVYNKT